MGGWLIDNQHGFPLNSSAQSSVEEKASPSSSAYLYKKKPQSLALRRFKPLPSLPFPSPDEKKYVNISFKNTPSQLDIPPFSQANPSSPRDSQSTLMSPEVRARLPQWLLFK